MYYDYAIDRDYQIAYMRGAAVWGKLEPRKKPNEVKKNEDPDREGFRKAYGDRIKRPEGDGPVVVTG